MLFTRACKAYDVRATRKSGGICRIWRTLRGGTTIRLAGGGTSQTRRANAGRCYHSRCEPVLDPQVVHTPEFTQVARHEYGIERQGVGRDQGIERPDRHPPNSEFVP